MPEHILPSDKTSELVRIDLDKAFYAFFETNENTDYSNSLQTFEREFADQMVKFFKFSCVAMLSVINGKITLTTISFYPKRANDDKEKTMDQLLKTAHPVGQHFLQNYLGKSADYHRGKIFYRKNTNRIFCCVPLTREKIVYVDAFVTTDQMDAWDEFVNVFQHEMKLHYQQFQLGHKLNQYESQVTSGDGITSFVTSAKRILVKKRKAQEKDLIKSSLEDLWFRQLIDQIPIGIFHTDQEGRCLYLNQQMLDLLGMDWDQAKIDGWASALHPEDAEMTITAWRLLKDRNIPFKREYRLCQPSGAVNWVHGEMFPEKDQQGEVQGYMGFVMDINKHQEAIDQLNMHSRQLENIERLNGMGAVATGLSHELSQPLTVILTYANACLEYCNKPDSTSKVKPILEKIVKNAQRASQILHRINELFHKGTLQYSETNIASVVHQALDCLSEKLEDEVVIQFELDNAERSITVDVLQIEQVIINLIKNALHSMQDLPKETSVLTLKSAINEEHIILQVIDTGHGIPKAIAKKIFEPFFSSKPENMGMGLALCVSIINAHHGKLELLKNDQLGSCFQVTLPRRPQRSI